MDKTPENIKSIVITKNNPKANSEASDIVCLNAGKMVKSSIINRYGNFLVQISKTHFSKAVFVVHTYIFQYLEDFKKLDLSELQKLDHTNSFLQINFSVHDLILIPIFLNQNHWSLGVLDVQKKTNSIITIRLKKMKLSQETFGNN